MKKKRGNWGRGEHINLRGKLTPRRIAEEIMPEINRLLENDYRQPELGEKPKEKTPERDTEYPVNPALEGEAISYDTAKVDSSGQMTVFNELEDGQLAEVPELEERVRKSSNRRMPEYPTGPETGTQTSLDFTAKKDPTKKLPITKETNYSKLTGKRSFMSKIQQYTRQGRGNLEIKIGPENERPKTRSSTGEERYDILYSAQLDNLLIKHTHPDFPIERDESMGIEMTELAHNLKGIVETRIMCRTTVESYSTFARLNIEY